MTLALEEDIRSAQHYGAVEAIVSRTVSSPSTPLYVKLVRFSNRHEFGPCPWQPRPSTETAGEGDPRETTNIVYPQKGDRCIAIPTDDPRVYWIPCYWPKSYGAV